MSDDPTTGASPADDVREDDVAADDVPDNDPVLDEAPGADQATADQTPTDDAFPDEGPTTDVAPQSDRDVDDVIEGHLPSPEDLPASGEADAAPMDTTTDEAMETTAGDPEADPDPADAEPAVGFEGPSDETAEAARIGNVTTEPAQAPDDPEAADTATPDPARADDVGPEEPDTPPRDAIAEATEVGDEADTSGDDLDDLLGMAGAEAVEPTAGTAVTEEGAAEATTGDTAEEEPAAPAVRRRPQSITDVRDKKDLMRLYGDFYVVHTYAGYEQRVRDNLMSRVEALDAHDRVFEVVIPTEEVIRSPPSPPRPSPRPRRAWSTTGWVRWWSSMATAPWASSPSGISYASTPTARPATPPR